MINNNMKARMTPGQHLLVDVPLVGGVDRREAVATQESPPFPLQQALNERRREFVKDDVKAKLKETMIAKYNKELQDDLDEQARIIKEQRQAGVRVKRKAKSIRWSKDTYKPPPKLVTNKALNNTERWQAFIDWVQGCGTYESDSMDRAKKSRSWIQPKPEAKPTMDENGELICIGWKVQQTLLRRAPIYQKRDKPCTLASFLSTLKIPTSKRDENGKLILRPLVKQLHLSTDFLVCLFNDLGDTTSAASAPASLPSSNPTASLTDPDSGIIKASKYGKHPVVQSRVDDAVEWESCIGSLVAALEATSDDSDETRAEKEAKLGKTIQALTHYPMTGGLERALLRPIECNKDAVEDLFLLAGWSEASIEELFDRRVSVPDEPNAAASDVSEASVSDEGESNVTIEAPAVDDGGNTATLDGSDDDVIAQADTTDDGHGGSTTQTVTTSSDNAPCSVPDDVTATTSNNNQANTTEQLPSPPSDDGVKHDMEPSPLSHTMDGECGSMYISDSRYPTHATVRRSCRVARGNLYREGMYKC